VKWRRRKPHPNPLREKLIPTFPVGKEKKQVRMALIFSQSNRSIQNNQNTPNTQKNPITQNFKKNLTEMKKET
jgi:hypothetical protein